MNRREWVKSSPIRMYTYVHLDQKVSTLPGGSGGPLSQASKFAEVIGKHLLWAMSPHSPSNFKCTFCFIHGFWRLDSRARNVQPHSVQGLKPGPIVFLERFARSVVISSVMIALYYRQSSLKCPLLNLTPRGVKTGIMLYFACYFLF